MKKALTIVAILLLIGSIKVNAQCTPDPSYTAPGTYPKCNVGLPNAPVGVLYQTTITVIIPKDTIILGLPIPIDSIGFTEVFGLPVGFTFTPNKPSHFWYGDSTGCALIEGTPTLSQVGTYPLKIMVMAYGGGFSMFDSIICYNIEIGSVGIETIKNEKFSQLQNSPNPFAYQTEISFNMPNGNIVHFIVYNILGDVVHKETFAVKQGENKIIFERNGLKSGMYMYKITDEKNSITKRMIISD